MKIPCVAKSVEIGQKPTRGRPAQARKALQHQQPTIVVAKIEAPVTVPVVAQTEAPVKVLAKQARPPKLRSNEDAVDSSIASDTPPSLVAAPRLLLLTYLEML